MFEHFGTDSPPKVGKKNTHIYLTTDSCCFACEKVASLNALRKKQSIFNTMMIARRMICEFQALHNYVKNKTPNQEVFLNIDQEVYFGEKSQKPWLFVHEHWYHLKFFSSLLSFLFFCILFSSCTNRSVHRGWEKPGEKNFSVPAAAVIPASVAYKNDQNASIWCLTRATKNVRSI